MENFALQFSQTLNQHSYMVWALAFVAGMVSSFLPCTIAMLPLLIGYIGGYTAQDPTVGTYRTAILLQSLMFILGLAVTLSVFGVIASLLGVTFGAWLGRWWYVLIGVVSMLMGLQLLGALHLPLPQWATSLPDMTRARRRYGNLIAPLLLGIVFGTVASPCGTPFLIAISGYISQEQDIFLGAGALFLYALGQGVLLLAAGLVTGLLKKKAAFHRVGWVLTMLSGWVFVGMGVIFIVKDWGWLQVLLNGGDPQ